MLNPTDTPKICTDCAHFAPWGRQFAMCYRAATHKRDLTTGETITSNILDARQERNGPRIGSRDNCGEGAYYFTPRRKPKLWRRWWNFLGNA